MVVGEIERCDEADGQFLVLDHGLLLCSADGHDRTRAERDNRCAMSAAEGSDVGDRERLTRDLVEGDRPVLGGNGKSFEFSREFGRRQFVGFLRHNHHQPGFGIHGETEIDVWPRGYPAVYERRIELGIAAEQGDHCLGNENLDGQWMICLAGSPAQQMLRPHFCLDRDVWDRPPGFHHVVCNCLAGAAQRHCFGPSSLDHGSGIEVCARHGSACS
jgi:hypothetical protein